MEIGLKWVHMARYGLILRLERALWLTIIFKPLLTPKGAIKIQKFQKINFFGPCCYPPLAGLQVAPNDGPQANDVYGLTGLSTSQALDRLNAYSPTPGG